MGKIGNLFRKFRGLQEILDHVDYIPEIEGYGPETILSWFGTIILDTDDGTIACFPNGNLEIVYDKGHIQVEY